MGIRKKIIPAVIELSYVCDNKACDKEGDDKNDFVIDLPVMKGSTKDKIVLCKSCKDEHDAFMERYGTKPEAAAAPVDGEYDPQTDPKMRKLMPDERTTHHKAKVWAMGPLTTVASDYRPKSVRGPAGEKVLIAYEIYLREQEIEQAAEEKARALAGISEDEAKKIPCTAPA